ncbi:hypothetical protein NDI43_15740 [Microcoleus vaginatus GB2-A3]|uniref:hypothetical protein n=1 Tax=Microcoleus vaginatus TaxID=119532 RepID=UPI0032AA6CF5
MLGGRSNTSLYLWASSINLTGRRKFGNGFARADVTDVTDVRKFGNGFARADVTDVTDVSPMEEGRRKKPNAVRAIFSAIKNVQTFLPVTIN